jgi:hypothetical protein
MSVYFPSQFETHKSILLMGFVFMYKTVVLNFPLQSHRSLRRKKEHAL